MNQRERQSVAKIDIYTLSGCIHCIVARRRLRRRGIEFRVIPCEDRADFRMFLLERTGSSTVPQILVDGDPIGGAKDLARLDRCGVLPAMIRKEEFPVVVNKRKWSVFRRRWEVGVFDRQGAVLETVLSDSTSESDQIATDFRQKYAMDAIGQSPD